MSRIDLAASKSCQLTLLRRGATEPNDRDRRVVILPGTATVRVEGHTFVIFEGSERMVLSTSMTYELLSSATEQTPTQGRG